MPQFKIAVNVRQGEFFCFNADEWHCNFPLQSTDGTHVRLSFVCYLRTSITRLCQKVDNEEEDEEEEEEKEEEKEDE